MPINKKRSIISVIILIVVIVVAWIFWGGHSASPMASMAQKAIPVKLVTVQRHNVPVTGEAQGNLLAPNNIILMAQQAGQVEAIAFKPGQNVKKGQVLIRINDVAQKAALANAEANLQQAKTDYRRYQKLYRQGGTSQALYDQYLTSYQKARALVTEQQKALSETTIVAPFSGIIGATQPIRGKTDASGNSLSNITQLSVGSYVNVGDALVQLVSLQNLEVQYTLPESDLALAKVGQKVLLTTIAYPGKTFVGHVNYISPSINTQSRTFEVYARVENPRALLKPGVLMQVQQLLKPQHQVIAVPVLAVASGMSGYDVYLVKKGHLVKQVVQIGAKFGGWIEITKGLKVGQHVVAENADNLGQGLAAKVVS